jgi:hypothetical protein
MSKISLLCPTKEREFSLDRMIKSAEANSFNPADIELLMYVDFDDDSTIKYLACLDTSFDIKIMFSDYKDPEIYSNLHNILANKSTGDFLFGCADDLIFRTPDWDTKALFYLEPYKDDVACFYPDDGHWGEKFGTHCFFTRKWLNTLGYLAPPIFSVDYSDNYVELVAKGIGRYNYMPDILIEHMHWTFGKSEFDNTALRGHMKRISDNNKERFVLSSNMIKSDIDKLKNVI